MCGGRLESPPPSAGDKRADPLTKVPSGKPFALQAAQASVAAPIIVALASCCGWPLLQETSADDPNTGSLVAAIAIGIFLLMLAAGFVGGLIGFAAGIRQRSFRLLFWSSLGLLMTVAYSLLWMGPLLSRR